MINSILWILRNRLVVLILAALLFIFGLIFSPFEIGDKLPKAPIAVDAIPDIGENQQIVFTEWKGRSPRDIDDQITYPLSAVLLGIPGVKTIRSSSMFGFSSIYVIFEENTEFYWSRSRILEKLNALPPGTLPDNVTPALGPDATALGQVFWYTLEGRDKDGNPASGWDTHELRNLQDWTVKTALQSAKGVAEVASIGGNGKEYQIEIFPDKLEAYNISILDLAKAVKEANIDIGARTMEINRVEYIVRGVGLLKSIDDIRKIVIAYRNDKPIQITDVAKVVVGPAERRGALDVSGAEAVGGIVVARFGANPVEVIDAVKDKIERVSQSLPTKITDNGNAKVTIVPVYDRSMLIKETVQTLSDALWQQILITILVVLFLLGHLRSSIVISASLPLSVMISFIAMKAFAVDANIMSLAGIAIAIGAMVDIGIVVTENAVMHLGTERDEENRNRRIAESIREIAPAVATSVATTVISFFPVFAMTAAEGKLFSPLAYTKTFAMVGALLVGFFVLPIFIQLFLLKPQAKVQPFSFQSTFRTMVGTPAFFIVGILLFFLESFYLGVASILVGLFGVLILSATNQKTERVLRLTESLVVGFVVLLVLTQAWMPLSFGVSYFSNFLFVAIISLGLLGSFWFFNFKYKSLLTWMLENRASFFSIPILLLLVAAMTWFGGPKLTSWIPTPVRTFGPISKIIHAFPGLEDEFMPAFDEGSFLLMPSTMPHASLGEASRQIRRIDASIASIPEIEEVVGKLGRADTALDPAPISMFESLIRYKKEWGIDSDGNRVRQWRDHIKSSADIWDEILAAAKHPGVTGAPMLMPINTRIVMLQSGMRAPMGIKVKGPTVEANEKAGKIIERALQNVPQVREGTVFAERIVGKPYIEIEIDRDAIARYGLSVQTVQNTIQFAIGGKNLTQTVEGRERHSVRIRYVRDERQSPDALLRTRIPTPNGQQIPLESLASIQYVRGPQVIKSENTQLVSYVTFDKIVGVSEVTAVEHAADYLSAGIRSGEISLPDGVTYEFSGTFESQVRSAERLRYLVPLSMIFIFLLLYLQFSRVSTTLMIFTSVSVAMSGGMLMLWFYNQPWFLNFSVADQSMRTLFHVGPTNLSVAIWVGFIALIGIATDDGVIMATYLKQRFTDFEPTSIADIRAEVLDAGSRRVRPCLMTTATTILALLPVITSTGRGSDIMAPMALPIFGGMVIELVTLFVVPLLWSMREEWKFKLHEVED